MLQPFARPSFVPDGIAAPDSVVKLAHLPTPIENFPLPGLPEDVAVLVKRDDATGGADVAGNKVRKLEFLFADALRGGYKHVATAGGTMSNHCRTTVAAARRLKLEPHLVLRDDSGSYSHPQNGNVLLNDIMAAHMEVQPAASYNSTTSLEAFVRQVSADQGDNVYSIPVGGTNALGCWGYISAVAEISEQISDRQVSDIVCAVGSGGTAAGLAIGCNWLAREQPRELRVSGYTVCDSPAFFYDVISGLSAAVMGRAPPATDLISLYDAAGEGYGKATDEELQFMSRVARETGVVLDATYSNKAAFAMVQDFAKGTWKPQSAALFIHTGGAPSCFAHADRLRRCATA